jgi:sulfate adenylyltransferase subunit 1 (EFTu-like GTPase family)
VIHLYVTRIDQLASIFIEATATMRRHSLSAFSQLTSDPVSPAIRKMLLMDYIEEVFEGVMSPLENPALVSPCALLNFVNTCMHKG